jgi:hypothetical protein
LQLIAALLPPKSDLAILEDVRTLLKGTIDEAEPERRPYQFQSRVWVQAVFHVAGVVTKALPVHQPGPDFLVEAPTGMQYGLEVKRPKKKSTIRGIIDKAVDQLNGAGLEGGIAVDLSDVVQELGLFVLDIPPDQPPYSVLDQPFERLYRQVGQSIFDPGNRQHLPGRRHVFFLVVFARGWCWRTDPMVPPELFTASQFGICVSTKWSLLHHRALHLRRGWERGLARGGLFRSRTTQGPM